MADSMILSDDKQEKFYSLLTKAGQAQIANAMVMNKKVDFVTMKVGDGGGSYYDPDENQTDLRNVVWEGSISEVSVDKDNPNWINIKAIIPSTDGGFTVREYGVYDVDDNLLAIAKCAETYKPVISDGSTKELMLNMVLAVVNPDVIELKIDPTVVIATKRDIEELRTEMIEMMNSGIQFVRPTGLANALTVKEIDVAKLYDGYNRTIIAQYDNDPTLATTVNGKNLYKPNTTDSPTIKAGKAYTFWYDGINDCFFIKASAEGDAVTSNVLANKSFSNSDDTGLKGTMPNNGKLNKTLNAGDTYTIPLGYTDGGTITVNSLASQTGGTATPNRILSPYTAYVNGNKITGTIPTLSAKTYTPSTSDQIINAGNYLGGNITIKGDINFKAENFANDVTIFGIKGTYTGGEYSISEEELFGGTNINKFTFSFDAGELNHLRLNVDNLKNWLTNYFNRKLPGMTIGGDYEETITVNPPYVWSGRVDVRLDSNSYKLIKIRYDYNYNHDVYYTFFKSVYYTDGPGCSNEIATFYKSPTGSLTNEMSAGGALTNNCQGVRNNLFSFYFRDSGGYSPDLTMTIYYKTL